MSWPVSMLRERPTDLHRYHAHECTPSLSVSCGSVLGLQAMAVTTASRTLRVSAGLSVSQAQALKSLKLQLLQDTRQCRFGPDRRNTRCSRVPPPSHEAHAVATSLRLYWMRSEQCDIRVRPSLRGRGRCACLIIRARCAKFNPALRIMSI